MGNLRWIAGLSILIMALLIWIYPFLAITIGIKLVELLIISVIANVISRVIFRKSLKDLLFDENDK